MEIHEFDVVKLKNGQEGTVLEILGAGEAFLVEIDAEIYEESDIVEVRKEDIDKMIWKYTA